jgi:hypothetical protein
LINYSYLFLVNKNCPLAFWSRVTFIIKNSIFAEETPSKPITEVMKWEIWESFSD